MKLKKIGALLLCAVLAAGGLTGCKSNDGGFDKSHAITVVTREEGSGTRGAFIELVGIEQKNDAGEKVDHTTEEAVTTNSTAVMMTTVAGDIHAIGYISLGSLNNTVKAVKVDGVEATAANVKNGTYKVSRPFNIATMGEENELVQDFINYILSAEGQKVIEDNGYIAVVEGAASFTSNGAEGKIVVGGSSSVTPVMEKLKEAYLKINTSAEIDIQETDSSTGMKDAQSGAYDIGMASRELKDSEKEAGLVDTVIALDGIAVIVHNDSEVSELTSEQIKNIYCGDATKWSDVLK